MIHGLSGTVRSPLYGHQARLAVVVRGNSRRSKARVQKADRRFPRFYSGG